MNLETVVTIIGAGIMGHALALIFALGGNRVFFTDISERILTHARELINSHLKILAESGELRETPDLMIERIGHQSHTPIKIVPLANPWATIIPERR